jgi:hypothetical protein
MSSSQALCLPIPTGSARDCSRQWTTGGTYQVIYRINDKERAAAVVDVAHRYDVYRT